MATKKPAATSVDTKDELDVLVEKAIVKNDAKAKVALRERDGKDVVPKILAYTTDERAKVRAAAYGFAPSIASWADLVPLETLIAGMADPEPKVRLEIMFRMKGQKSGTYRYAKNAKVAAAVKPLLEDPDKTVREQAGHVWKLLELG